MSKLLSAPLQCTICCLASLFEGGYPPRRHLSRAAKTRFFHPSINSYESPLIQLQSKKSSAQSPKVFKRVSEAQSKTMFYLSFSNFIESFQPLPTSYLAMLTTPYLL